MRRQQTPNASGFGVKTGQRVWRKGGTHPSGPGTGGSPHPVDVLVDVGRGVKLDDPLHPGDVQPAGGDLRPARGCAVVPGEGSPDPDAVTHEGGCGG